MPDRIFTADYVSDLDPTWRMLILPLLPQGSVRCLEIGSFEGRSACWILDNILKKHPGSRLDCVDLWPGLLEQEQKFDHNTASEPQIVKHKGFSVEFLTPLVDQPPIYDFIYVDGDHRAEMVFSDAMLGWQCLKKKGVMVLDDYIYEGPEIHGVPQPRTGINAFLKIHESEIFLLEMGRQVIVQKRRDPGTHQGAIEGLGEGK